MNDIHSHLSNPVEHLTQTPGCRASPQATTVRGLVVEILSNGQILVGLPDNPPRLVRCDWLETELNARTAINIGDHVLVAQPATPDEDGIVLGRIGRYHPPQPNKSSAQDCVSLEAVESLTLSCGESSLQLRKDGKLMILGNDLLIRAKRTARIKGGSVAIN